MTDGAAQAVVGAATRSWSDIRARRVGSMARMSDRDAEHPAMLPADPGAERGPGWRVGSALDRWWSTRSARTRRILRWSAPAAVMATAVATRIPGLAHPHELVFDEVYYVRDGWTTWNLGYEGQWPEDTDNARFNGGDTSFYSDGAAFAVHPPLGKWIIGAGMALFGSEDSAGWRIAVAVFGVLLVGLIMFVGHRLTGSLLTASMAGGLLAIDGNAIVLSSIGILDGLLAFFALLGFAFVLLDRAAFRGQWWARPWLLAAGLALGAATSIKWSGLWFLLAFGLWTVASDAMASRNPWDVPRRAAANIVLLVPAAALVYLASYTGWFVTDGGYDRHWAELDGNAATGLFAWVPTTLQSWWHLHEEILRFHSGLRSDHPYASQGWSWPLLLRPVSFWWWSGSEGCASGNCAATILDIPNPVIWYASWIAAGWLVVALIRRRDRVAAVLLVGLAAGWAPWLVFFERPTYFFYTIAFEPFLVLALAYALSAWLGRPGDESTRRWSGIAGVALFLLVAVGVSAFFLPVWTGMTTDYWFVAAHWWSPSWI